MIFLFCTNSYAIEAMNVNVVRSRQYREYRTSVFLKMNKELFFMPIFYNMYMNYVYNLIYYDYNAMSRHYGILDFIHDKCVLKENIFLVIYDIVSRQAEHHLNAMAVSKEQTYIFIHIVLLQGGTLVNNRNKLFDTGITISDSNLSSAFKSAIIRINNIIKETLSKQYKYDSALSSKYDKIHEFIIHKNIETRTKYNIFSIANNLYSYDYHLHQYQSANNINALVIGINTKNKLILEKDFNLDYFGLQTKQSMFLIISKEDNDEEQETNKQKEIKLILLSRMNLKIKNYENLQKGVEDFNVYVDQNGNIIANMRLVVYRCLLFNPEKEHHSRLITLNLITKMDDSVIDIEVLEKPSIFGLDKSYDTFNIFHIKSVCGVSYKNKNDIHRLFSISNGDTVHKINRMINLNIFEFITKIYFYNITNNSDIKSKLAVYIKNIRNTVLLDISDYMLETLIVIENTKLCMVIFVYPYNRDDKYFIIGILGKTETILDILTKHINGSKELITSKYSIIHSLTVNELRKRYEYCFCIV